MDSEDKQKTLILAQKIDDVLKNAFLEIDPNFYHFYTKELNRLRKRDALHQQINVLKKYESSLNNFNKKLEKYNNLMKHKDKIKMMYRDWKDTELSEKKRGERGNNVDVDTFFTQRKSDILCLLQTDDERYITLNELKKVLRDKSKKPSRYLLQKPQEPQKLSLESEYQLKKDEINLKYSKKQDYELLMELGIISLENLDYSIKYALDSKDTSTLYPLISFIFCHSTSSTTKGKEYERTDNKKTKDPSKTSGDSFEKLYTEYLNLIKTLEINVD